jgi:hypothetical protein
MLLKLLFTVSVNDAYFLACSLASGSYLGVLQSCLTRLRLCQFDSFRKSQSVPSLAASDSPRINSHTSPAKSSGDSTSSDKAGPSFS